MMSVTGTLMCMMSAIIATCLLMLSDSAVVKTRSPLYHMNYVTYPPSTTLLTGTPYYFGTYPTMPPVKFSIDSLESRKQKRDIFDWRRTFD